MATGGAAERRRLNRLYTRYGATFREEFGDDVFTLAPAIRLAWLGAFWQWLFQASLTLLFHSGFEE